MEVGPSGKIGVNAVFYVELKASRSGEDIVLSLMHVDGEEAVEKLRESVDLDYFAGKLFVTAQGKTSIRKETELGLSFVQKRGGHRIGILSQIANY